MESLESLMAYCTANGRICPQPQPWNEVWKMLPAKERKGAGWEPALPLILAAWWVTPLLSKKLRFQEHIQWAADHNALDAIGAFLRALPEDQWYCGE